MAKFEFDGTDLRSDANDYWDPWSRKVLALEQATRTAYAPVTREDWSGMPGAQEVRVAFETFLGDVGGYLHTGSDVMEGIARTLRVIAAAYAKGEDDVLAELAEIRAELAATE